MSSSFSMLLSLVICSFQELSFLIIAPSPPHHHTRTRYLFTEVVFFLLDFQCTAHYSAFRKEEEGEGAGKGNQEEEKYQ